MNDEPAATTSPNGIEFAPPDFTWQDQLTLGDPAIDGIHREFVDMMQSLYLATDAQMLETINAVIDHTEAHFRHETTLMQLYRFPPIHCHETEHANVLEVMQGVRDRVAGGDYRLGRVLAAAMIEWLQVHVPSMDAVLVAWLRERGVDETSTTPAGLPADAHHVQAAD